VHKHEILFQDEKSKWIKLLDKTQAENVFLFIDLCFTVDCLMI